MPAGTPYERQLLVECIRRAVARWGAVCVAAGRRQVLLRIGDAAADALRCVRCGGRPGPLRCRGAASGLCLGCALDAVLPRECIGATIAADPESLRGPARRAASA